MMKKNYSLYNYRRRNVTKLPVYRKALYIFKLSRQIVEYLRGDKSVIELHNSKIASDQFSDKLVMTSLGLAPKIAMAEATPDPTIKLASISSIQKNTAALLHYCESLELTHGQGKEFLHLLRKEVKKFGHLQNKWALGISNKN
ncbi:hypothetical protein JoomaDRAFT_2461 [Galbibacter orientalis DSM 19592]|uniref:Four helix bundle protein n=1 Tax=Galbibacter orientalis DSM 19592 TaxID=926559 RepID=I3C747_9FLAO|nr:hypothetical protein [Galbibacter orientalis]EIJ39440.1 hypothetical protein JoomaDRAFT_2461 [Galbibacter orientalis DSM 19592]